MVCKILVDGKRCGFKTRTKSNLMLHQRAMHNENWDGKSRAEAPQEIQEEIEEGDRIDQNTQLIMDKIKEWGVREFLMFTSLGISRFLWSGQTFGIGEDELLKQSVRGIWAALEARTK